MNFLFFFKLFISFSSCLTFFLSIHPGLPAVYLDISSPKGKICPSILFISFLHYSEFLIRNINCIILHYFTYMKYNQSLKNKKQDLSHIQTMFSFTLVFNILFLHYSLITLPHLIVLLSSSLHQRYYGPDSKWGHIEQWMV